MDTTNDTYQPKVVVTVTIDEKSETAWSPGSYEFHNGECVDAPVSESDVKELAATAFRLLNDAR